MTATEADSYLFVEAATSAEAELRAQPGRELERQPRRQP